MFIQNCYKSAFVKLPLGFCLVVLLTACAVGAKPFKDAESAYQRELQKVKMQSENADFLLLRMSFTDTAAYKPYAAFEHKLIKRVNDAFGLGQNEECLAASEELLSINYTSLYGHFAAMECNLRLGEVEKGRYHRYVLKGLMESIGNSGDGRSPESSYITISPAELRAFVQMIGLTIQTQELVSKDGQSFDVMTVVNPETGDQFSLTFDISTQLSKGFQKSK